MSSSTNQVSVAPVQNNVAIDVVQQLGQKQPPTNNQISEILQKTQTFLDEKQNDSSVPPETLKTLNDFKGVLEATEQLNRNKNEDEGLQKLIVESGRAARDLGHQGQDLKNHPSMEGKGGEVGAKGKQLSQAVWEILKLMGTNGQFRQQINSLIGLLQEMFLADSTETSSSSSSSSSDSDSKTSSDSQSTPSSSVETDSLIKPSVAASSNTSFSSAEEHILELKRQTVDTASSGDSSSTKKKGRSWRVNPPSEEKKQEMAKHFLSVMRNLNENEQFKNGLQDLIDLFQDLKQQQKTISSENAAAGVTSIKENEHVDVFYTESKKLIEKFSGRPIDPFVEKTKTFFTFVRKDERSRTWLDEFIQLLKDSVRDPHNLDEKDFTERVRKLINDATGLTKEQEFREKYADVTVELSALGNSIKEDEDLKNLQVQTQKFLENFTYTDENGQKRFDTDLVTQLRTFIVPLLISQLDQIPVPPIQGSNQDTDYFFDNMVLNGRAIIPDQVEIHTQTDVSLNVNKLSASHGRSNATISVNNIKPEVSDIHFRFTRNSFPKLSDEGIANVRVQGDQGISIRIELEVMRQGIENLFQFTLTNVVVDIERLVIEIVEAKHDMLLKLFTSVYQTRVKKMMEQKIAEKLQQIILKLQEGLNSVMTKYPPSKLKSMVSEKIGSIKGSSGSSSKDDSHSATALETGATGPISTGSTTPQNASASVADESVLPASTTAAVDTTPPITTSQQV